MRFLKILLFVAAFVVVWVLVLRIFSGASGGEPGHAALLITSLVVLVPFLWLGRRLFRGEGSRRVSRIEEAAAAATAAGVARRRPSAADDEGKQEGDTAVSADTKDHKD